MTIKPFQNEEESESIDELTIENRLDRISIYGSLEITRDKAGLKQALALKEIVDATVAALKADKLPEHISIAAAAKVDNPFK